MRDPFQILVQLWDGEQQQLGEGLSWSFGSTRLKKHWTEAAWILQKEGSLLFIGGCLYSGIIIGVGCCAWFNRSNNWSDCSRRIKNCLLIMVIYVGNILEEE
jgi:hypothetical protein